MGRQKSHQHCNKVQGDASAHRFLRLYNQLPTIMPEASSFALRSKGSVAGLVQSMIAIRSCANNCTLAATLIPTIRQDIPEGQSSCLQVLCLTSWQHRDDL